MFEIKTPTPSTLKVGDLVKIDYQFDYYDGKRGFIEQINGDGAYFIELVKGGSGGAGDIPLARLILANDDAKLQNLKIAYDKRIADITARIKEHADKYNYARYEAIKAVSLATGVEHQLVDKIFIASKDFDEKWNISNDI
jgi:methionine aminopeptidase